MSSTARSPEAPEVAAPASPGQHFSCTLSAVLLARVRDFGGDGAVRELLERAGGRRSVQELSDIVNWISYEEAVALWRERERPSPTIPSSPAPWARTRLGG